MRKIFVPGCALMLYKPHLAEKLHVLLENNLGKMSMLNICCRHDPKFSLETEVINICPGCDKRFRSNYDKCSTISLWEILAFNDFFPFPDHSGKVMSIIDACPARNQEKIHEAIRILLAKMNIKIIEPKNTKASSVCCGDSLYGTCPIEVVKQRMIARTDAMPCDDVVVYCVSCTKSVFIGGKRPHYLLDLLFDETTIPKTLAPDEWHKELDDYITKRKEAALLS